MKRKLLLLLFCACVFGTQWNGLGQTADGFVLQGKNHLAVKNLTNANASFAAAVALSPNHQTANALFAATRLLTLPDRRPTQDMMDRLGVALTNRNIYHWTARLPTDTNGIPVPPNDFNVMDGIAFVRTNFLPEVTAAIGNLAKITDTNFILTLSSNETSIAAVILDFGDIQMLRALLHAVELECYTINSYNFSIQLNALYSLYYRRGELTAEGLLADYPLALTFATTNDFQAAQLSFENGVERYLLASEVIRSRSTNITRLFNYDAGEAIDEAQFRQTLVELKDSLQAPVVLTNGTKRVSIELGNYFRGTTPLRSFIPEFRGNGILLGSLPDPTFGGLVFGLTPNDIYPLLGTSFALLPHVRLVRPLLDGRFELQVGALDGRNYAIETSNDLVAWTEFTTSIASNGALVFTDTDTVSQARRFYRVKDLAYLSSFEGAVVDSRSAQPIKGALVSSSLDAQTTFTDVAGHFYLQTRKSGQTVGFYTLTVAAPGYTAKSVQGFYYADNHLKGMMIPLSP